MVSIFNIVSVDLFVNIMSFFIVVLIIPIIKWYHNKISSKVDHVDAKIDKTKDNLYNEIEKVDDKVNKIDNAQCEIKGKLDIIEKQHFKE